ncbi:MAG: GNAT family N-acetyltransferase, partial [Clostridiales bacterium]|nr:GNAT family N-acetyltransferase [Clostridiales bacterium]
MTEAVSSFIDYAFNHLGVNIIFATCSDKNIASYKVMEKCNMIKIKTENNHKSYKRGVEITYNRLIYCIEKQ